MSGEGSGPSQQAPFRLQGGESPAVAPLRFLTPMSKGGKVERELRMERRGGNAGERREGGERAEDGVRILK
jgi:hypothetical protein